MNIIKTKVTGQESPIGGTWAYKILVDTDKGILIIPSNMGYGSYNEAIEAGVKYAQRIRKENEL